MGAQIAMPHFRALAYFLEDPKTIRRPDICSQLPNNDNRGLPVPQILLNG